MKNREQITISKRVTYYSLISQTIYVLIFKLLLLLTEVSYLPLSVFRNNDLLDTHALRLNINSPINRFWKDRDLVEEI